jgi:hypothetical protein
MAINNRSNEMETSKNDSEFYTSFTAKNPLMSVFNALIAVLFFFDHMRGIKDGSEKLCNQIKELQKFRCIFENSKEGMMTLRNYKTEYVNENFINFLKNELTNF